QAIGAMLGLRAASEAQAAVLGLHGDEGGEVRSVASSAVRSLKQDLVVQDLNNDAEGRRDGLDLRHQTILCWAPGDWAASGAHKYVAITPQISLAFFPIRESWWPTPSIAQVR